LTTPDECDIRKVQTLGDHLRAQQDVDAARAKVRQDAFVAAGFAHRIGVHPRDAGFGESGSDLHLQLLRPETEKTYARRAAVGTRLGAGNGIVAVMTECFLSLAMVREGDRAIRTADRFSTRGTLDRSREAAAVEQQNDLAAVLDRLADGGMQLATDGAPRLSTAELGPQIQRPDVRQRTIEHAAGQAE
jgi:hypothetical protein